MHLSTLDWGIIAAYMLISLGIGLWFSRRGSKNLMEYFVAGRDVTWWLAGISMVATTFAADTPLVVAKIVRTQGLIGNWIWWSGVMGAMVCVYYFAALWRRANIITDAEFMELRYAGGRGAFLRGFYAFFRSIFCNSVILGWVILAMYKIVYTLLGWPKVASTWILVSVSVGYIFFSGLWGVLATDLFQFVLAMAGCVILAVIVMSDAGGPAALVTKAVETCRAYAGQGTGLVDPTQVMNIFPNAESSQLVVLTFVALITLQWWQGAQGDGFMAQRLFSCKNEKHSLLSVLFYGFLHYAVRPWPWIIIGLGSIVYFPSLADPEMAFPSMMVKFLPSGLRGMLVAAFFAAFMSTVSTHINLGASYLVSDIYKRFIKKDAPDRHYVVVSWFAILLMTVLAGLTCLLMKSVYSAWLLGMALMSGPAIIFLLRWYWWRINAWSEITALVTAIVSTMGLMLFSGLKDEAQYPQRLFIIIVVSTAVAVLVTLLTKPEPMEHLEKFYRRVRPGGWWGPVAERCPDVEKIAAPGGVTFLNWLLSVACVYSVMFGLGWLIFGFIWKGALALLLFAVLLTVVLKRIERVKFGV